MTKVVHASAGESAEQLPLEFEIPEAGTTDVVVPADVMAEIVRSPVYLRLAELRDAAYERRRSGARAIAREAFAALQAGELTKGEYLELFTADQGDESSEPQFEDYSQDPPARPPDWAERAAGEAVRHPWDEG